MIFPSEKKKELWRYASKNNPATCDGTQSQLPPLHHHQHRHLPQQCNNQPQQREQQAQRALERTLPCCWTSSSSSIDCYASEVATISTANPTAEQHLHRKQHLSTPPPPYTPLAVSYGNIVNRSLLSIKNRQSHDSQYPPPFSQQQSQITPTAAGNENTMSSSSDEELVDPAYAPLNEYTKVGYSFESIAEDMQIEESEQPTENRILSYRNLRWTNNMEEEEQQQQNTKKPNTMGNSTMPTQSTTTFAMTAASIIRNCCGGGLFTVDSNNSITTPSNTDNNCNSQTNVKSSHESINSQMTTQQQQHVPGKQRTLTQDFNGLIKQLKSKQIAELLRAVKSRFEPPMPVSTTMMPGTTTTTSSASAVNYSQCILIKRSAATYEEQYVTACRLFFWFDLKDASELRRLPVCSSERDRVYVCCNPLHWCRILETESLPPPYRRSNMQRLKVADENSQVICGRTEEGTQSCKSISSIDKPSLDSHVPESFTTDGEDRRVCSMVWCQIAYWELAQRVGAFYRAVKPSINIYSEGYGSGGNGAVDDGMCLKDLADHKSASSTVYHTRQKIGLGITLSLDADGVWIYNRASIPIFVDSPTLNECLNRVCKVMPGYCLKAFDTQRAQTLNTKNLLRNPNVGPIDHFSMKISFAKGWGYTYTRQDIMGCPCWLEVHFPQLR